MYRCSLPPTQQQTDLRHSRRRGRRSRHSPRLSLPPRRSSPMDDRFLFPVSPHVGDARAGGETDRVPPIIVERGRRGVSARVSERDRFFRGGNSRSGGNSRLTRRTVSPRPAGNCCSTRCCCRRVAIRTTISTMRRCAPWRNMRNLSPLPTLSPPPTSPTDSHSREEPRGVARTEISTTCCSTWVSRGNHTQGGKFDRELCKFSDADIPPFFVGADSGLSAGTTNVTVHMENVVSAILSAGRYVGQEIEYYVDMSEKDANFAL